MKLWDVTTGTVIRSFEVHSSKVVSVALSPDGSRELSGSYDAKRKLWDATTGALIRSFDGHSAEVLVAYSPDGARVLSGSAIPLQTVPAGSADYADTGGGRT